MSSYTRDNSRLKKTFSKKDILCPICLNNMVGNPPVCPNQKRHDDNQKARDHG